MNNIYITSDTHFNHQAIIEYCYRPKNYEQLIDKELKKLTENDILLHLGDICMGKDEEMHKKYIQCLPCKKWLVLGNHDTKSSSWYLTHGWDFVAGTFSVRYMGRKIIFSHRPREIAEDFINIHGHLHNLGRDILSSYPDEFTDLTDRHLLISQENSNYKLFKLTTILKNFISVDNLKSKHDIFI